MHEYNLCINFLEMYMYNCVYNTYYIIRPQLYGDIYIYIYIYIIFFFFFEGIETCMLVINFAPLCPKSNLGSNNDEYTISFNHACRRI